MKVQELFEAPENPTGTKKAYAIWDKTSGRFVRMELSWGGSSQSLPAMLHDASVISYQSKSLPAFQLDSSTVHGNGLFKTEAEAQKMVKTLQNFKTADVTKLKPHEEMLASETGHGQVKGEMDTRNLPSWKRLMTKYKKMIEAAKDMNLKVMEIDVDPKTYKKYLSYYD